MIVEKSGGGGGGGGDDDEAGKNLRGTWGRRTKSVLLNIILSRRRNNDIASS